MSGFATPPRQNQAVVPVRLGLVELHVDRLGAALVEVVHHLDLLRAERHELELGARLGQSLHRRGELDLLHALRRREYRDPLPVQLPGHRPAPHCAIDDLVS
jgi:hypothetical protein